MGVLLGVAASIRYFNAAELGALAVALFVLGRRTHAAVMTAAAATTLGTLLAVPLALHVSVFQPGQDPWLLSFTPEAPILMLVSDRRGLFVWSPVTLLAAVGIVALIRHRPDLRPFLLIASAMAVSLLLPYAAFPAWDGGGPFLSAI